ncbi:hypothetical protein NDU88_005013 [Pleurodeles waltl]|uniref:Uncharacterized protein n=1 Tax=Pleurodeles waltl TaxID=8319 RepID=A0AAV7KZZ1_PLEWA|nr:hypothetical protein NDU88_005013 [Pleurodeles waltl]
MLVLGARQGGRPGNPEGNPEGSGGSGGQRGTAQGRACTDCATSRARSFGRRSSTGPASSLTRVTSRHHKVNLGSFSGVSLGAISHKTIPKLLTVGILLVGGGVKQLQQRGTGGREALLGPRAESLQQEGGAPPPSLLVAALTGASPAPSPTPLMPFCRQLLPLLQPLAGSRLSCHGCRGIAGAAACRYHRASSRLSGCRGCRESHSHTLAVSHPTEASDASTISTANLWLT